MGTFVIILCASIVLICNIIVAGLMGEAAKKKGYGEEAHIFAICFWLGIVGYLYVIALPDLTQRKQLDKIIKLLNPQESKTTPQQDVAWKLQDLTPESPKGDGSADAYLQKMAKTPEEYKCTVLSIMEADERGECFVCNQKQKITKHCRIKRDNIFRNIPICTDCINVFIEYNPNAVYNFESLESE